MMNSDQNWYARPVSHGIARQDVPPCPLCDSPRKHALYEVQEHEYDNTTSEEFRFVRCANCGVVRLNPRPDVSELGRIYPPDYYAYNLLSDGSDERAGFDSTKVDAMIREHLLP